MQDNNNNNGSDPNEIVSIRAPRRLWLEFILHFSTLGIYTAFWFVARMREFNQLSKTEFKPWLWFFVPFFWIAQTVALPKFIKTLNNLAEEQELPKWSAWHGGWTLAVILITVGFNIFDRIEVPGWVYLAGFVLWSSLFTAMQAQVNRIKEGINGIKFQGSRHNYSKMEWLLITPLLPISLFIMYSLAIEPLLQNQLQVLQANTNYHDPQKRYSFPVIGKGWSIIENGTHSNGEAQIEFQGPLSDMYFVIFDHGQNETIDSVSNWRKEQLASVLNRAQCNEERNFAKSTLSVVARVKCTGSVMTDPAMVTVSIIETDKGIYEFYGMLTSVKYSYRKNVSTVEKMARGFEPL